MTPPDLAAILIIRDALEHDDIPVGNAAGAALFIAEAIHDTGLAFTWETDTDGLRQETKGARGAARKASATKGQADADETDEEAMT